MRKNLTAGLALLFAASVGETAFAASNPFDDVPKTHWSYDAIKQLVAEGIVVGDANKFNGDKSLTRYEMSVMVARMMAKEDKANAAQKAVIDKLSREYKSDLENMGVRIEEMQKQIDRVTFHPLVRVRYEDSENGHWKQDGGTSKGTVTGNAYNNTDPYDKGKYSTNPIERNIMFELGVNAKISDDWQANMRMQTKMNFFGSDLETGYETPKLAYATVTGPLFGTNFTLGKFENAMGKHLIYDNDTTGEKLSFDIGKIKTTVFTGRAADKSNTDIYGTELKYAASPATNVSLLGVKGRNADFNNKNIANKPQYLNNPGLWSNMWGVEMSSAWNDRNFCSEFPWGESSSGWDKAARTSLELGVDTKITDNLVLSGAYAKSDNNDYNKAYMIQLDYKGAKLDEVGSYGLFAKYAKVEPFSAIAVSSNVNGNVNPNERGILVGFNYTPMKNCVLSGWYFAGEYLTYSTQHAYNHDTTRSRIQMQFFF